MKKKTIKILYISIALLFAITFFFPTIAVPVEDEYGNYGGIFWTSMLYQLSVNNYNALFFYSLIFIGLIGEVHIFK